MPARKTFNIITLALVAAMIAGCGGKNLLDDFEQPETVYTRASNAMRTGNLVAAIDQYQYLIARFPNSNSARQAQLDIIYAFYRARRDEEALDAADAFQRENPTHPRVDYAIYMQGLIFFDRAPGILERIFDVDLSARPPSETMDAYNAFQDLIRRYPSSRYVADARKRMEFIRNRLAQYQNHVARYYMERQAFVAAANRARNALATYPGAPALEESLQIMVAAYERMGMTDLATDARRVLESSFP